MRLLTYQPELLVTKQCAGLIDCQFKHELKGASADMKYLGPKIDPEVWKEILAFFQWTYDTTHSESQVRLYVHLKDRRWRAWAFPQEARTGMTAKELDTEDAKKQRAMFNDSEGWQYFGTVHHHCSAPAFQSGTDSANEVKIDGLHITVGQMASQRYDMHARFYLSGWCFEPDMAKFWEIPANLAILLPYDLHDRIARWNMCEKVKPDTRFPDEWKVNLIEVKTHFQTYPQTTPGTSQSYPGNGQGGGAHHGHRRYDPIPAWMRARRAVAEFALEVLKNPYNRAEQIELSEWLRDAAQGVDTTFSALLEVMEKYEVDVMEMWTEIPPDNTLNGLIATYKADLRIGAGVESDSPARKAAEEEERERRMLDWRGGGMMD